eukprot:1894218-Pyramimonas_sp.AAC.1
MRAYTPRTDLALVPLSDSRAAKGRQRRNACSKLSRRPNQSDWRAKSLHGPLVLYCPACVGKARPCHAKRRSN